MDEKEVRAFNLVLTLDEINTVLGSLANGPFNVVADLIAKVRAQVMPQLPASEPPVEKVTAEEV